MIKGDLIYLRAPETTDLDACIRWVNDPEVTSYLDIGVFPISRRAELGIMIGEKDCWSQGYGTDAVQTIVRFGFEQLNLRRIFLRVFSHNPRAIRCYEKCGFIEEGRLRAHHFVNGKYVDELVMGLLVPS